MKPPAEPPIEDRLVAQHAQACGATVEITACVFNSPGSQFPIDYSGAPDTMTQWAAVPNKDKKKAVPPRWKLPQGTYDTESINAVVHFVLDETAPGETAYYFSKQFPDLRCPGKKDNLKPLLEREAEVPKAPSIILTEAEHKEISTALNEAWTRIKPTDLVGLRQVYKEVYGKKYPQWLEAIESYLR